MRKKNRTKSKHLQVYFNMLIILSFISSCSLLTSKNTVSESQNEFKQVLKKRNYTDTVPVEIASEFNELASKNRIELPVLPPENQLRNPFEKSQLKEEIASLEDDSKKEITESNNSSKRKLANENKSSKSTSYSNQNKSINKSINKKIDKFYKIKNGDTLMKISFQEFGDIFKWRKILNDNKAVISNYNYLIPGTEIQIKGETYIVVNHNGKPYLIQKNDTLSKISHKVYGNHKKWNLIWKNNLELIKDPNKIYQGFTLYYEEIEAEQLKNKMNISTNQQLKNNMLKTNENNKNTRKIATTISKTNNLKNTKDQPESLSSKEE